MCIQFSTFESNILIQGRIQGGGGGPGLQKKIQVYTFIVASERKKTQGGGVQFEILRNLGIDFYSGSRNPKKSRYRLL